jgi:hypothetical protein
VYTAAVALDRALERYDVAPASPTRLRRRVPYPISALPAQMKEGGELLLFCGGAHAGWHLAAWSDGAWRAVANPNLCLEPTHFALARGLANDDGRWRHAVPRRVVLLSVAGVVGAAFLAMVAIGQIAYGDPWALCAPARDSLAETVAP